MARGLTLCNLRLDLKLAIWDPITAQQANMNLAPQMGLPGMTRKNGKTVIRGVVRPSMRT